MPSRGPLERLPRVVADKVGDERDHGASVKDSIERVQRPVEIGCAGCVRRLAVNENVAK